MMTKMTKMIMITDNPCNPDRVITTSCMISDRARPGSSHVLLDTRQDETVIECGPA